jgi:hypothetical protein
VGVVTANVRDPDQILAQVKAKPSATLENDREVMLLWFDARHPAAPVEPRLIEQLPEPVVGQPVLGPPAPVPVPAAAAAPKPALPKPAAPKAGAKP